MMRLLAILAIVAVVMAAAYGSAATLTVSGGAIQAGVDSTLYCDPDGVAVSGWGLERDDNSVRSVTIGGIDAACFNNILFARVLDGSGNVLVDGKVDPVSANTATINFPSPYLNPSAIEGLQVWIEGPAG